MKIIKKVNERFDTPEERKKHHDRHVTDTGTSINNYKGQEIEEKEFDRDRFANEEEYENGAEELANKPVTSAPYWKYAKEHTYKISERELNGITGYLGRDGRIHKFEPSSGEFTAYKIEDGEYINLTYHIITIDRWERMVNSYKKEGFYRALRRGEDII